MVEAAEGGELDGGEHAAGVELGVGVPFLGVGC